MSKEQQSNPSGVLSGWYQFRFTKLGSLHTLKINLSQFDSWFKAICHVDSIS